MRKLYKKFEAFKLSIDWNIAESLVSEKNRDLERALLAKGKIKEMKNVYPKSI